MPNSKRRYKVWLGQAYYDLQAAKNSFKDRSYEWSCYQSVQATEKMLKAVLVHAGWSPPKTHKLGVLVGLCNRANKVFVDVKLSFRKLEAYTFISRYPFVYPSQKNAIPHEFIHIEDAQTCLDIAQNAYDKISGFLLDNADYPTEIINTRDYYFTAEEVKNRIDEIVVVLSEIKQISVEKIILFGTFAREKDRPKMSTMDILVIGKTDLSFIDRIEYVREATKGGEPILEPLVYTPEEFNYMLNDEVEGFLETAIAEGKVIYENPSL